MSNRPDEALVDAALASDVLAAAVEEHLDRNPVPVDEAAVRQAADRVSARIAAHSAAPRRGRSSLAFAATVVLLARAAPAPMDTHPAVPAEPPAAAALAELSVQPIRVRLANGVQRLDLPQAGRTVDLGADARALVSDSEGAAVVLMQSGVGVADDGVTIHAHHWAVLAPDHRAPTVVFADGVASPPALADRPWADVDRQLRALRWAALPPRTLDTLEDLLQEERR